jgi:hypothetical protein
VAFRAPQPERGCRSWAQLWAWERIGWFDEIAAPTRAAFISQRANLGDIYQQKGRHRISEPSVKPNQRRSAHGWKFFC